VSEEMKIETIEEKQTNGQIRWMKVIKLELPWPHEESDKKAEFIVKKMNFGERNKYMNSFMNIAVKGQAPSADVDMGAMNENSLLFALNKAPFQITLENIRNLEIYISDPVYAAVNKLNSLGEINEEAKQTVEPSAGQSNTELEMKS